MIDKTELWIVILALGAGSFGLRFVFTGLIGDRPMPQWVLRHLRYTAVAVLPALIAPLVVWPAANDGAPDPARLMAAGATTLVAVVFKNALLAILAGAITLYTGLYLLG